MSHLAKRAFHRPLQQCLLSCLVAAVAVAANRCAGAPSGLNDAGSAVSNTIDLAGTWRFRLDLNHVGVEEKWFTTRLPGEIHLPGTTDEAKLGIPNPAKPSLDGLYRPNVYAGPAWYQRDIEIPETWKGGRDGTRVRLLLERVHWETRAWLDDREIGSQDSLIAPHDYDLGYIESGKHKLTIRVDNSLKFNLGNFVSINYEGTQTNWNGIVGKLELRATPAVWIDSQRVFTKNDGSVKVEIRVRNEKFDPAAGTISATVIEKSTGKIVGRGKTTFSYGSGTMPDGRHIISTYAVEEIPLKINSPPRLWGEFSPELYDVTSQLTVDRQPEIVSRETTTFGFRDLQIRGTQFVVNGRPIYLRGTLECAIFPKTGYPSMDVPSWQRIFRILKSYGLNFMRFHSWCPPEAAFAAADIEGFYLQVEGPEANIHIDRHKPIGQFMEQELLRIVRTYGNHPSFCLMTLGNEHSGVGDTLEYWVKMLRDEDPRHLYSSASCGQGTKNSQFIEDTSGRGVHGPGTMHDVRGAVAGRDRPTIGHEIGQWTFFPNFDEIAKYNGVLEAKNFELVRDDLAKKHLLDLAPQFFQATGRHAVLLYKEEIEVLRRTPNYPGFSLLDMHDYPGQGTALIGPLDPFWDSKGFVTPVDHSCYCGPTAPLIRLKKRTFSTDETLTAEAEISHFGPTNLATAQPLWTIRDEKGTMIDMGVLPACAIPSDALTPLGRIEASLSKANAPCKLKVSVSINHTPIGNSWDIWVYPSKIDTTPPKNLVVSREWNDSVKTTLAQGGRVLLFATSKSSHSLPGRFLPVFWSPVWFPTQVPNTMGILCDPKHPALADFPTEFHSNWQWYDLLDHSRSIILDDTPADFRPTVMVIDNFARNHKLGVIFEARVGSGRLLVCGIDLPGLMEKQPAARQLLACLQRYAVSDKFQPRSELPVETLDTLFGPAGSGLMQRLGAKVILTDSEAEEYPASNVIDGNPETIWHTPWEGDHPPEFPHYLVIRFPKAVTMRGVKLLPRQDMPNGRIRDYELYASNDGKNWGQAVKKGRFSRGGALQIVEFAHPVEAKFLKLIALGSFERRAYASLAEGEVVLAK
jgi:hypothetical protein